MPEKWSGCHCSEGGDAVLGKTLENYRGAAGVVLPGMKMQEIQRPPGRWFPGFIMRCRLPLRALFRFGHWLFTVRRKLPYKKKQGKSCKNPAPDCNIFFQISILRRQAAAVSVPVTGKACTMS